MWAIAVNCDSTDQTHQKVLTNVTCQLANAGDGSQSVGIGHSVTIAMVEDTDCGPLTAAVVRHLAPSLEEVELRCPDLPERTKIVLVHIHDYKALAVMWGNTNASSTYWNVLFPEVNNVNDLVQHELVTKAAGRNEEAAAALLPPGDRLLQALHKLKHNTYADACERAGKLTELLHKRVPGYSAELPEDQWTDALRTTLSKEAAKLYKLPEVHGQKTKPLVPIKFNVVAILHLEMLMSFSVTTDILKFFMSETMKSYGGKDLGYALAACLARRGAHAVSTAIEESIKGTLHPNDDSDDDNNAAAVGEAARIGNIRINSKKKNLRIMDCFVPSILHDILGLLRIARKRLADGMNATTKRKPGCCPPLNNMQVCANSFLKLIFALLGRNRS